MPYYVSIIIATLIVANLVIILLKIWTFIVCVLLVIVLCYVQLIVKNLFLLILLSIKKGGRHFSINQLINYYQLLLLNKSYKNTQ